MARGKRRRNVIPVACVARVMKNAGAERVSRTAVETALEAVVDYLSEVTKLALQFAKTAGRKTVKQADVKNAIQILKKGA